MAKLSILGFDLLIPTFFENYNEMIVGVPSVNYGGKDTNFTYMPVLRLDNFWAIIAGRFYGFNKEEARFDITPEKYEVLKGAQLLTSSGNTTLPVTAESAWIDDIFKQPLLGFALGVPVCSSMNWNFDTAAMQEDRMTMKANPQLVKGMPVLDMSVLPLDPSGKGAFHLVNSWELTAPSYGCLFY